MWQILRQYCFLIYKFKIISDCLSLYSVVLVNKQDHSIRNKVSFYAYLATLQISNSMISIFSNASSLPYRSGFVIDGIPAADEPPTAEFITQHQSLIGGLALLHILMRK
jgi:hypothetical protein